MSKEISWWDIGISIISGVIIGIGWYYIDSRILTAMIIGVLWYGLNILARRLNNYEQNLQR